MTNIRNGALALVAAISVAWPAGASPPPTMCGTRGKSPGVQAWAERILTRSGR